MFREHIKSKSKKPGLYLISPNNIELKSFRRDFISVAETRILKYFQLRLKEDCDEKIINLIKFIFPICKKFNIKFIINDRPDIAKAFDLDGVHIGKNDPSITKCKSLLSRNKIIGVSCYSSNSLAKHAQDYGASYIAFGSFFDTKTKDKTNKIIFPNIISWNNLKRIPSIGIGGIKYRNIFLLRKLNLDYLAFSSSVWKSKISPVTALKKIKNLIDNY